MTGTGKTIEQPTLLVFCPAFPVLSQTFVVDHVVGMAQAGWKVIVVAGTIDVSAVSDIQFREHIRLEVRELPDWHRAMPVHRLLTASSAFRLLVTKVPFYCFSRVAWASAMRAVELRRLIGTCRPAIIHAHFGPSAIVAAMATDLPLIANFHGYDFTSWPKHWGWSLYRETLEHATVLAHSDFAVAALERAGLGPVNRITMGVDVERFVPTHRPPDWQRPLRLLSVGRLVPQKGHAVALRVLAGLRESRPDLDPRLRIVGSGPEKVNLERLAVQLAINDYVEGPIAVDSHEMPAVYKNADLLLAASLSTADGWMEAFCRSAVEGMACGIPVAATPCGGLPDTVGTGGFVAGAQEAGALIATVERLIAAGSPAHWERRARESACRFRLERMREEYSSCTSSMLRRSDGPSRPENRRLEV